MTHVYPPVAPAAFQTADVRVALTQVLLSDTFGRAQRMRELLRFLVEQKLSGTQRDTHEYAVGIEVFKRDPATYNTCTDPIVRVQVGRLRERLRAYYAGAGQADPLRFVIPVGSYMPEIAASSAMTMPSTAAAEQLPAPALPAAGIASHYRLAHCTIACLDPQDGGAAFARGLNEELVHRLYCAFGVAIVPNADLDAMGKLSHRLEGSLRIDGGHVRLSLRLVDNGAGSLVWSQQFDGRASLSIHLQEQLAGAACAALNQYFALG